VRFPREGANFAAELLPVDVRPESLPLRGVAQGTLWEEPSRSERTFAELSDAVGSLAQMSGSPKATVAGLFAGIGGIEAGLHDAGLQTVLLCEWDEGAQRVLSARFPGIPLVGDIADLPALPSVDLVSAGFPCQDLSQAGRTAGIRGSRSGLVGHVFRLLDTAEPPPTWLLLENVSFMLSLDRGRAMTWLTDQLEERGYMWAYRVVDSRAFGLPQRRQRVLLLASRTEDPRPVLLNQDVGEPDPGDPNGLACGFYWTEGIRGLGWALDAVPTLKGGSTIGIPSPPAIYRPGTGRVVTPDLRDAERLQGFAPDWTIAADESGRRRKRTDRWKLVGNAVTVPVSHWLGERLSTHETYESHAETPLRPPMRWPRAAWGRAGTRFAVDVSMWPVAYPRPHLHNFLQFKPQPLSARATAGFLKRTERGNLRIPEDLICEARAHLERLTAQLLIAA
jgi:DNA (cytosine-5)-methyltransferase 1